ncbi:MAG TPA: hypothetical protein VMM93_09615, partial [Vicinamibacterales bacterium]|nr:hypothetical protein [Vicinamibacterales bacterium]
LTAPLFDLFGRAFSGRDLILLGGGLVVLAVAVMMLAAESISTFVERHPTIKILALSFLLLIGLSLVADGLGTHIPKGYVYFAMGFSMFVEAINIRIRRKTEPVQLRKRYEKAAR